jgi:hypothetical protein
MEIAAILSRWIHIASVVILIGGVFYASFLARSIVASFRPVIWTTTVAILVSGLYNLMIKEGLPPGYHMYFGIKMLLVLHIFGVGLMATTRVFEEPKRVRLMKGVAISGLVVALISAFLRGMAA